MPLTIENESTGMKMENFFEDLQTIFRFWQDSIRFLSIIMMLSDSLISFTDQSNIFCTHYINFAGSVRVYLFKYNYVDLFLDQNEKGSDKLQIKEYNLQKNIQMISNIINIHKNFILKPNPYVTQQQAQEVYTKFAVGEFMMISAAGCFALSLFRFVPRLSQNVIFKKFTVVQAVTGLAAYGWIGSTIPSQQLQRQKQVTQKVKTLTQRKN